MTTRQMRVPDVKKPRLLAGRFSRAERRRQRAKISLDEAALTYKTQVRYYTALRKMITFVEQARNEDHLDTLLCNWIRKMWYKGEPLLTIGDGLSALHFFQPWTRRKIPHSWKLFSVWRKVEIPSRAPPLTWELVSSMAAYEWEHHNFQMAVLLLVSFHCLLRTGECLSITPSDVALGPTEGILSLKGTKTGLRHNADEAISITHPLVLEFLRVLVETRHVLNTVSLPIWTGTAAQFRSRFQTLVELMGLETHNFRPYSLRRGGATDMFQQTKSMEAALIRGRWESSRVARLYISDGLSYLPTIKMSEHTKLFLHTFNLQTFTK